MCKYSGIGFKVVKGSMVCYQALHHRMVRQVRALVVLPVQDLAAQVYHVFLTYTQHTDLKVVLVTGQTSFHKEQQQLVGSSQLQ
jgi:ATP-dependent RNA helicase DDX51/DBP6